MNLEKNPLIHKKEAEEDLNITNNEELEEAKTEANVVSKAVHIERMLNSGDPKLIEAGIQQMREELKEKEKMQREIEEYKKGEIIMDKMLKEAGKEKNNLEARLERKIYAYDLLKAEMIKISNVEDVNKLQTTIDWKILDEGKRGRFWSNPY